MVGVFWGCSCVSGVMSAIPVMCSVICLSTTCEACEPVKVMKLSTTVMRYRPSCLSLWTMYLLQFHPTCVYKPVDNVSIAVPPYMCLYVSYVFAHLPSTIICVICVRMYVFYVLCIHSFMKAFTEAIVLQLKVSSVVEDKSFLPKICEKV